MSSSHRPDLRSRVLHVMMDSPVCVNTFRMFEEFLPGANDAVVLNPSGPLRHVLSCRPRVLGWREALGAGFLESLGRYRLVLIQYMDELRTRMVIAAPRTAAFVWMGWGGDYYHHHDFRVLEPATAAVARRYWLHRWRSGAGWIELGKQLLRKLVLADVEFRPSRLFSRIGFFATLLPQDLDMIRDKVGGPMPVFLPYNFWYLEDQLNPDGSGEPTGANLLLGNSATWTNNHLEVLQALPSPLPAGIRLITPLNYGDPECRNRIVKEGRLRFGDSFHPLLDMLDLPAYRKLTATCAVAIMNHRRQQGVGTVQMLLHQGARVYLNPDSPLTPYFRDLGLVFFSTRDLAAFGLTGLRPLDAEDRERNRSIVLAQWGREAVRARVRGLLDAAAPGLLGAGGA